MSTNESTAEGGGPIVEGVDGSPESLAAPNFAVNEARLRGCGVQAVLVWSDAAYYAEQLLAAAAEGAQLLVLGSRGRGGFAGLLLGSIGHQCVGRARCPVVVVPGPAPVAVGA